MPLPDELIRTSAEYLHPTGPTQRMQILRVRVARGWTVSQVAERLLHRTRCEERLGGLLRHYRRTA